MGLVRKKIIKISSNFDENSTNSTDATNVTSKPAENIRDGGSVSNKEQNLAIGLCCALGVLIIAIIIYWNVHRKRKKARLEKEKQEKEIIETPDDLLPHS